MLCFAQCNVMQCFAQCNAVPCFAQCNAVKCFAQCKAVQCFAQCKKPNSAMLYRESCNAMHSSFFIAQVNWCTELSKYYCPMQSIQLHGIIPSTVQWEIYVELKNTNSTSRECSPTCVVAFVSAILE